MKSLFSILDDTDAETLRNYLVCEHPQIIALVLCFVENEVAMREVVSHMPEGMQADIIMRISKMESVSESALENLGRILQRDLSELPKMQAIQAAFEKAVSCVDASILKRVKKVEPELAERIGKAMSESEE